MNKENVTEKSLKQKKTNVVYTVYGRFVVDRCWNRNTLKGNSAVGYNSQRAVTSIPSNAKRRNLPLHISQG